MNRFYFLLRLYPLIQNNMYLSDFGNEKLNFLVCCISSYKINSLLNTLKKLLKAFYRKLLAINNKLINIWASLMAQMVKNLPAVQETQV